MVEYSEESAFKLIKKIIGLDPKRNVSGLYFFGDIAYEEDETDGNPAIYFQIPSRRKTYDVGGETGIVEIGPYVSGYYDLVKKRIVSIQIPPEDFNKDYIFLDVEWTISKFRSFLGWYGVDINALNYLHGDKLNLKRYVKRKPMPPWVEKHIREREWLKPYEKEKIPKREIEEAQKDLLGYLDFVLKNP